MKRFLSICFVGVIISQLVSTKAAMADFFQDNVLAGNEMASDRYFSTFPDPEFDYGIETSDNFSNVSVDTSFENLRVNWWGSVETGTTLDQFAIRFYNASGAVPAQAPFYSGTMTPTLTPLLTSSAGRDHYRY